MAQLSKEISEFMKKYGVASDEVWLVPGGKSHAIKHAALERIAVQIGIKWSPPREIEMNAAEGVATIWVEGCLGETKIWSYGEASPRNNKNAYCVSMAEKRGKDRVILKLLSIHGGDKGLYSEMELDAEYQQPQPRENPHVTRPKDVFDPIDYSDTIPAPTTFKKLRVADQRPIFKELQDEIQSTGSIAELKQWAQQNKDRLGALKPDWQEFLRGVYAEHQKAIQILEQGDDNRLTGGQIGI